MGDKSPVKVRCHNERFYLTEVPVIVISKLKFVKPVVFEDTSILKVAEITSFGFIIVFSQFQVRAIGPLAIVGFQFVVDIFSANFVELKFLM